MVFVKLILVKWSPHATGTRLSEDLLQKRTGYSFIYRGVFVCVFIVKMLQKEREKEQNTRRFLHDVGISKERLKIVMLCSFFNF